MVNNSDTESEPESFLPACSAADFTQTHNTRDNQHRNRVDSAKNAAAAVETLSSLDLKVVQKVCLVKHFDSLVRPFVGLAEY
jgi:hypothetical protein